MKRTAAIIIGLLCGIIIFSCASANTISEEKNDSLYAILASSRISQTNDQENAKSFRLPLSLTTIENSAFEGTAITTAEIPWNVTVIGEYAFADIKTLKEISIPNAMTFIGSNAFRGSIGVTISGAPKGYAKDWTKENGIPFRPVESFYAFNTNVQVTGTFNRKAETEELSEESIHTNDRIRQPTGRMSGELNAARYEDINAFHIQGRSPPMG